MGTARKQGYFVLENRSGQVVRTIQIKAEELYLIIRQDTRRVEVVGDLSELDENEVPYTLISGFSADEIKTKPFKKEGMGTLRFVENVGSVVPLHKFENEEKESVKELVKWVVIAHVLLLGIVLGVSKLYRSATQEEQVTVTVFKQSEEPKVEVPPPPKMKETKVSEKKIMKSKPRAENARVKRKVTVARQIPVKSKSSFVTKTRSKVQSEGPKVKNKPRELGEMGALGAIGGFNKSAGKRSGLDVGAVSKGGLAGLGAGKGRSGTDRAISGSGLVGMSAGGGIGSGSGAGGGGGYNTRGMGTGHSGYGKQSMAGSSAGYASPLESEAEVEGGLTKSQIDAVIRRHQGEITYCYEKSLQSKPNIRGRIHYAWKIGPSGRVSQVAVEDSSVNESSVESCIAGKIRGWKFPKPAGNSTVSVNYPFALSKTM